jgi:tetratricopeptide (TPR) repeat protein
MPLGLRFWVLNYHASMLLNQFQLDLAAAVWVRASAQAFLALVLACACQAKAQLLPEATNQTATSTETVKPPPPAPAAPLIVSPMPVPTNVEPLASRATADLIYALLIAEISASRGELGKAHSLMLDLAQQTGEAALFERAYRMAFFVAPEQAVSAAMLLRTTQAWRQALPQSRDAIRANMQILIALNRLAGTLELMRAELALSSPKDSVAVIAQMPHDFARATDKKMAATLVEQALTETLQSPKTSTEKMAAAWLTVGVMRLQAQNPMGALTAAKQAQLHESRQLGAAKIALDVMAQHPAEAEPVVLRYLQNNPSPAVEVRMGLARAWIDTQRYAEAGALLQAITRDQSTYADAWLLLGVLQTQEVQLDAAAVSLRRYINLSNALPQTKRQQGQTQAFLSLSKIAEKKKDFAAAEAWLRRIEDTSEFASAQIRRANLLAKQSKLAEGRKLLRDLPALSAQDEAVKAKAEFELLRDHKHYEAAYDWAEQMRAANPSELDWLYEKAMMAEKLDRMAEMERLLRQLIALKPNHHHAYNALGYSLAERNLRLGEARRLIKRALELAPGDPFITDSLGWVEFRTGKLDEALKVLRAAYKIRADAEIAAHLGEVLWTLGKREPALQTWRAALISNPDSEALQETLKRLRVKP